MRDLDSGAGEDSRPSRAATAPSNLRAGFAPWWKPYAHRSAGVPGCPVERGPQPEDFCVEEVGLNPSIEVVGEDGVCDVPASRSKTTQACFFVEKRKRSTGQLVGAIAKALGRPERQVSYCGRKDKHAVTRQWLAVSLQDEALQVLVERLKDFGLSVLQSGWAQQPLRLGQHMGNRFRLRVLGFQEQHRLCAETVLNQLREHGLPNFFGSQRFGISGDSHFLGACLLGESAEVYVSEVLWSEANWREPERSSSQNSRSEPWWELADTVARGLSFERSRGRQLRSALGSEFGRLAQRWAGGQRGHELLQGIPLSLRKLHASAWQSYAFHHVLAERFPEPERMLAGDWLVNGAASGPLPGPQASKSRKRAKAGPPERTPSSALGAPEEKPSLAQAAYSLAQEGHALALERRGLASLAGSAPIHARALAAVTSSGARGLGVSGTRGARRPLTVPVSDLSWEWEPIESQQPGSPSGAASKVDAEHSSLKGEQSALQQGPWTLKLQFQLPRGSFATTLLEELRKAY